MQVPPALPPPLPGTPVPRTVLLINPFYAKDPNASFGKHVLTPTLALTSIAGRDAGRVEGRATGTRTCCRARRRASRSRRWSGITVHLTFAARAYELAAWYRARGAKVVLGGLHALSCPDEVAAARRRASSSATGCPLWPHILARPRGRARSQPRYHGRLPTLPRRPAAATRDPAARGAS